MGNFKKKSDAIKHFEQIYRRFHHPKYLGLDPLVCVHEHKSPKDLEVAGLYCSLLAYGRVEMIIKSIQRLNQMIDNRPLSFCINTTFYEKKEHLLSFKHRFNSGYDLALFFQSVGDLIKQYGSLGSLFAREIKRGQNLRSALTVFTNEIHREARKYGEIKRGFEYLVSSPEKGSACKRLLLYLRWMIRKQDGIDLGIWKNISPSLLLYPVDTHVAKIARHYGITKRNVADWRMAEEITDFFRNIDSSDPVRFDFSLCRAGILAFRKV
ncbi:TIGR02757 family protein [Chitinispirillales bacterium ANBcel5]|uniref:TIGR02757 family protein n=1 Tax=Cellulosispirillum alkaliphilum TaxID=3039283 RepID=UPI002A55BE92|nr:TIGR02757 family protein [Chitinispirillales bacterium ANBcel5]